MFNFLSFVDDKTETTPLVNSDAPTQKKLKRYDLNPIISPDPNIAWRAKAAFNPAAVFEDGKIHLLYRAMGYDNVSVFGYASSIDGLSIQENLADPIYRPTQDFEMSTKPGWNSGCEDPRITKIGNRFYLTYTAYDGTNPPRVALTSISVSDFLVRKWNWDTPKLISPPGVDDKDACIFKNDSGYFAFHRLGNAIWFDRLRDLSFPDIKFLTGGIMAQARTDNWDNIKIGIAGPPIETEKGLLLIYHAVCNPGFSYKIGAMLLDPSDPRKILSRTKEPLLEPEKDYELQGIVPNVVFSCGSIVMNGILYLYYGGCDTVVGVATMPLSDLLNVLSEQ